MNDSTTPDPAEQERRERIPSLQGDTPLPEFTTEAILAHHQDRVRRAAESITFEDEGDGLYTITFRHVTPDQAARIIRRAGEAHPLPAAGYRAIYRLRQIAQERKGQQTRGWAKTDAYIAFLRHTYLSIKATEDRSPSHGECARIVGDMMDGKPITTNTSEQRLKRADPPTSWSKLKQLWQEEVVQEK